MTPNQAISYGCLFARFSVPRTFTKSARANIIAVFVLAQMRILDAHLLNKKSKRS